LKKDNTSFWTWFLIWIKTGKFDAEDKPFYRIFLVTNKHNIIGGEKLIICFNKKDWWWVNEEEIDIPEQNRIYYANEQDINNPLYTDIIMLHIDFNYIKNTWYETYFIIDDCMITDRDTFENELNAWHEIYLLWFPLWMTWLSSHCPIARQWIIARNDKELLDKREIYLDVNNFPWNSWGPIILKPESVALEWKEPMLESKLIWVIKSYSPYAKTYYDISTNPPTPTFVMSENSWIAQWIPSYILYEMWKKFIDDQTGNWLFPEWI
jgi:hypothetical protein